MLIAVNKSDWDLLFQNLTVNGRPKLLSKKIIIFLGKYLNNITI